MVTHYFTLEALCRELQPLLSSAAIADVFTQQKNELIVALDAGGREQALAISVEPGHNYFYLRDAFARAKKNSVTLFPELIGQTVAEIGIASADRVITITTASSLALQCRLYNTVRSNLHLVDSSESIVASFKQGAEHAAEHTPAEEELAAHIIPDAEEFRRIVSASDASVYQAVKEAVPLFGSTYAREALYRANAPELGEAGTIRNGKRRSEGVRVPAVPARAHRLGEDGTHGEAQIARLIDRARTQSRGSAGRGCRAR